jgi:hypothetical protein
LSRRPLPIEQHAGFGLSLQKLCKLRRSHFQLRCSRGNIPIAGRQSVECFGQEGWKVGVFRADGDLSSADTRVPGLAGRLPRFNRLTDLERQIDAQSLHSGLPIQILAPPLARCSLQARRPMLDDNCRLDLVSVLAARPTATSALDIALSKQNIGRQGGGVHHLAIIRSQL